MQNCRKKNSIHWTPIFIAACPRAGAMSGFMDRPWRIALLMAVAFAAYLNTMQGGGDGREGSPALPRQHLRRR